RLALFMMNEGPTCAGSGGSTFHQPNELVPGCRFERRESTPEVAAVPSASNARPLAARALQHEPAHRRRTKATPARKPFLGACRPDEGQRLRISRLLKTLPRGAINQI